MRPLGAPGDVRAGKDADQVSQKEAGPGTGSIGRYLPLPGRRQVMVGRSGGALRTQMSSTMTTPPRPRRRPRGSEGPPLSVGPGRRRAGEEPPRGPEMAAQDVKTPSSLALTVESRELISHPITYPNP